MAISDKVILSRKDYNNKIIRLTRKQYDHIIETHPEAKGQTKLMKPSKILI